jgi:hypothetical protein
MNGNVGQQIKEQAQIERAKREAKLKPPTVGGKHKRSGLERDASHV